MCLHGQMCDVSCWSTSTVHQEAHIRRYGHSASCLPQRSHWEWGLSPLLLSPYCSGIQFLIPFWYGASGDEVNWIYVSKIILVPPKFCHIWAFWSNIKKLHIGMSSSSLMEEHGCEVIKVLLNVVVFLMTVQSNNYMMLQCFFQYWLWKFAKIQMLQE